MPSAHALSVYRKSDPVPGQRRER